MHLNSYGDTMFMAIEWALQDRETFLDAISNCTQAEKDEVERQIRALHRLKKKLFPGVKTELEAKLEKTRAVSITELQQMVREGKVVNRADREPQR